MYRILIIEDDRTIANVLAEHLRTWDYEVHCVTNFKNVMEDFREYEPQLVLLDIVLPLFNGFHWCQEIRKISKVPIIFLSSANDNMNIVMAMNMGGDEFVEKAGMRFAGCRRTKTVCPVWRITSSKKRTVFRRKRDGTVHRD